MQGDAGGEARFSGQSHLGLVEYLAGVFERVEHTRAPHWVALRGPQGVGKSGIVWNFYRTLANAQRPPGYWPPPSLEKLNLSDRPPLPHLKAAWPARSSPDSGGRPGWFWWGIDGAAAGPHYSPVVDSSAQFDPHLAVLEPVWPSVTAHLGDVCQRLGAQTSPDEKAHADLVVDLAKALADLASEIPLILFVKSADHADQSVATLCTALFNAAVPALIITLSQPAGRGVENRAIESALEAAASQAPFRVHDIDLEAVPEELSGRYRVVGRAPTSGAVADALDMCRRILAAEVDFFGPGSLEAAVTRRELVGLLSFAGRLDDAIVELETLLADQSRTRGLKHRDTHRTMNDLAYRLGQAGRVPEAIARFEALLAVQTAALGAAHPETLATQGNLWTWRGRRRRLNIERGKFVRAEGEFPFYFGRNDLLSSEGAESLVRKLEDVLGRDHPDTQVQRNIVAYRRDQEIRQREHLVSDLTVRLGANDPQTLRARFWLSTALRVAGRLDRANACSELLLNDQTRVLGASDRETLHTRWNLAWGLGQTGQAELACEVAEQGLLLAEAGHGTDSPAAKMFRKVLARRGRPFALVEVARRPFSPPGDDDEPFQLDNPPQEP